jgi:CRP-like cAMP-binding protein
MPTSATPKPARNRLLDRLPKSEYKVLIDSQKNVSLTSGEEIYRQDIPGSLRHVYFPTSGMVSLTIRMEDGKEVEAATIGNEGVVGLPVALGLDYSPIRAITQISGGGVRVPTSAFLRALKPGGMLDGLMRRYAAYSLRYANQTIACNLLHTVEQRLCRWLLMSHDRVQSDEFSLTHKFLAEMLGVRRQTVTVIARALQTAGLIKYRRGVLHVLNREGLELASCECYGVITTFYDRIMELEN